MKNNLLVLSVFKLPGCSVFFHPIKKTNLFHLCLVIILVASVFGCGGGGEPESGPGETPPGETPPVETPPTVTGQTTDPSGDAFSSIYASVMPDIVDIKTVTSEGNVTFQVRFKAGSFVKSEAIVTIAVDADRKTTGMNMDGLGVDYFIYMGSNLYGANAAVMRLTGSTTRILEASLPVTFLSDGMDVTIPLSVLSFAGPVTAFNYRLYASVLVPGTSTADIISIAPGRVDTAPDLNLSVASSDTNSINSTLMPISTTWTAEQVRQQIIAVNIDDPVRHAGFLVRWNTPIEVNTSNIARAEKALARYEALTGGMITFNRVTHTPTNGVVFVEGVAKAPDGSPGCGNVSNVSGGLNVNYQYNASGVMNGLYYINLGSTGCNDATTGDYDSAIAEHEMGHVLGVWGHFEGFTGREGVMNPNYFNVIYNIYKNPIGTTAANLNITVVAVGQFGFYY